jgi:PAS domain S-box-containing protein
LDYWQSVFEHALDAILVADDSARYVDANPAACQLLGYTRDELLKLSVSDLTTLNSREEFDKLWNVFLQTGKAEADLALRCKDGSVRWVDYRAVANIQPGRHFSVLRDITERRRMEERLRQSEERLKLAQEAAKLASFQWDIQANQFVWSKELEEIYGFPKPGSIGGLDNWRKRVHREDLPNAEKELQSALETGTYFSQYRFYWPDGTIRWLHSRAKVFYDDNRKPIRMVGVNMDITDLKRTEEALRDRTTQLQIAILAARLGSWRWDIESDKLECSEQCRMIFGMTPEIASSYEKVLGVVHPEDRDRVRELLQSSIRNNTQYEAEFRVVWPDGSEHWVLSSGRVIRSEEKKPARMVGVCLDITERKAYDQERDELLRREQAARKEAESANQAKDQFLAMVSHELRSPLSAILGWSRMLEMKKLDAPMTAKALEVIQRSAVTQAQMIEDLLDFSRIVAGKLRLSVEEVDVRDVIHNVVESLTPAAEARSVQIDVEVLPPGLLLHGDPMRFQQIIHNLTSNAIKFTRAGGRVSIGTNTDGTTATIRISDTGAGISKEFLPHVFESFRQAESGSNRRHGGLGLGLAIVKRLVEMHEGTVSADSGGPGLGATFIVALPLASSTRDTFEQETIQAMRKGFAGSEKSETLKGLRILVVDDQAAVRKMLKAYLEHQGAEVRPSATVDEAIEELQEWTPDVLLSDISLPDEDGLALISRVRLLESGPARDVLAIALTGHTQFEDRVRALSAGFQSFLSKHVQPAELVSTIATLVKSRG